jgi:hypothetical protein
MRRNCGGAGKALEDAVERAKAEFDPNGSAEDRDELVPVRITVGLERKTYQFAAIAVGLRAAARYSARPAARQRGQR